MPTTGRPAAATMKPALTARLATLLQRWAMPRPVVDRAPPHQPPLALAGLNQARRAPRHPSVPAYRQRRPARPAWPFPADGPPGQGG